MENHRRELRRRDVVARPEKRHPRHHDADQFDQLAEIFRRCVSPAHETRLSHALDNACPSENFFLRIFVLSRHRRIQLTRFHNSQISWSEKIQFAFPLEDKTHFCLGTIPRINTNVE